jgi:hypothetical protein
MSMDIVAEIGVSGGESEGKTRKLAVADSGLAPPVPIATTVETPAGTCRSVNDPDNVPGGPIVQLAVPGAMMLPVSVQPVSACEKPDPLTVTGRLDPNEDEPGVRVIC